MKEYYDWNKVSPPKNTWVWAVYKLEDDWQLLKTCKRGCCVHSLIGTMALPNFWYFATEEEGLQEELIRNIQPQFSYMDLYS